MNKIPVRKSSIDDICINSIRMLAADAVEKANSGHPGMPMGDAPMAYTLWTKFLRHNPSNPKWPNRDRFVLSAGHGSALLYSLLHLTGHAISLDDIKAFRQWESKTPGHPEYDLECGIETTTGPLGQGFAVGVGMAMAERYLSEMFNKPGFPIMDHYVYGIVSDGDLMEGVAAEAASLAGHLKLGKIIYLYSDNKITIEGSTDLSFTEDVGKRFEALGWQVLRASGNDINGIEKAIRDAKKQKNMPSLVIVRTNIGFGSPNKQDTPDVHGSPLGEKELKLTKEQLRCPDKSFYIPKAVSVHMKKAVICGRKEEKDWTRLLARYKTKHPELGRLWDGMTEGRLPEGWEAKVPVFTPANGPIATRSASGKVLNAIADSLPQLIGGSADLAPSNNTNLNKYADFGITKGGRNIHFGVREHAMAATLNGMAHSGMLIPYGGTFFVFSDYMRPSIRLSALMGTHVIYVLTHDSIGLGEDGPTHQPVEHLASLRAMPGINIIRPADANETAVAWKIAIRDDSRPHILVLSRQNLDILDRKKYGAAEGVEKGGYILSDSKGTPDIILITSGSEVRITLEAADILRAEGRKVRVVNMASTTLFDAQPDAYKKSVLPAKVDKRLAIEAGSTFGWHKYVGLNGDVIGIDRFGASAPAKTLFENFGFTASNIVNRAKKLLKS